jgi:aryl sulfotransferase
VNKLQDAVLPAETVIENDIVDSGRWDNFPFRADDIVIATFGKTGTTWVQQIVGQLIFRGAHDVELGAVSPWVEYRAMPRDNVLELLQRQQHRRFVKTHLPKFALPFCKNASYIYVAREPRDQIWSAYDHIANLKSTSLLSRQRMDQTNSVSSTREFYLALMNRSSADPWPYWAHVFSWWQARHLPNVLLVHYTNLKSHFLDEVQKIARFLNIEITEDVLSTIVEHTTFAYMKRNADRLRSAATDSLKNGPAALLNQGQVGRWRLELSPEDVKRCDDVAAAHLPPECVHWLATGKSNYISG